MLDRVTAARWGTRAAAGRGWHGRTGCRSGRGGRSGQVGSLVPHETDDGLQRGVVAELGRVVAGNVIRLTNAGEDLGLLDGVDAEVGLQIEVERQHVRRVARLFGDQCQHALLHWVFPACAGRGRRWRNRRWEPAAQLLGRQIEGFCLRWRGLGGREYRGDRWRREAHRGRWRRGSDGSLESLEVRGRRDGHQGSLGGALILDAQGAVRHLQLCGFVTTELLQVALPPRRIDDPVVEAHGVRLGTWPLSGATHQRHADL